MSNPLVSIIIPTYNRADLISETLDSVLYQSVQDWECIIVDDGSEDETFNVVQQYALKDKRFRLYSRPDEFKPGGSGAKNYGIEVSKSNYIMFLDSDDIYDENFVGEQIKKISGEPETTICFSKYYTFHSDISNAKTGYAEYYRDFLNPDDYVKYYCLHGYAFYTACLIASRTLIEQVGGWNEELTINDDGEFLINVTLAANRILFAENAIAYYRVNPSGKMLFEYPEKADHIIDSLRIITDHIISRSEFDDLEKYCATLFIHLKFLYPNDYSIWKKTDKEIEKHGGEYFYIGEEPFFNLVWKTAGLRSAFFYRRIKNYISKHIKKSA